MQYMSIINSIFSSPGKIQRFRNLIHVSASLKPANNTHTSQQICLLSFTISKTTGSLFWKYVCYKINKHHSEIIPHYSHYSWENRQKEIARLSWRFLTTFLCKWDLIRESSTSRTTWLERSGRGFEWWDRLLSRDPASHEVFNPVLEIWLVRVVCKRFPLVYSS